jgi:hypothetical protein
MLAVKKLLIALLAAEVLALNANRTHYSNGKPRKGATTFAPDYGKAKGDVTILTREAFLPQTINLQNEWASQNDIRISYKVADLAAHSYQQKILDSCGLTNDYDLIVIDATETSVFENCTLDLLSWNFDISGGVDTRIVDNAVVREKLVAMPFGISI